MGWPVLTLSEICSSVFAGGDVPKDRLSKFRTAEFTVPIYSNGEKKKGLYGFTDIARVTEPSITVSARGTIGYSEVRSEPFLPVVRLIVLTPNLELVELEYLKYVIQSMDFKNSGSSIPQLTVPMIKNYSCEIPPISEQKRIVAILDQAVADIEQARAKTEQNLKNARELFESYLQQVFSQRGEGWVEKTLADVCLFENGDRGKNYPSRSKFVDSGVAFINAGHIDDGTVDFEKMNYITKENYDLLSRGKIEKGDVLFCLRGSLGKFAVIDDDIRGAIASSLVIIRPHSDLSIEFFLHYLRSGLCKSMIDKYAGGAAQPNLGAKDLAKFSISVPTEDQQKIVSSKLNDLMGEIDKLEFIYRDKLAAIGELKKSILQKAFSGELTKTLEGGANKGVVV
jgi:type I restriction enzyme S subunit